MSDEAKEIRDRSESAEQRYNFAKSEIDEFWTDHLTTFKENYSDSKLVDDAKKKEELRTQLRAKIEELSATLKKDPQLQQEFPQVIEKINQDILKFLKADAARNCAQFSAHNETVSNSVAKPIEKEIGETAPEQLWGFVIPANASNELYAQEMGAGVNEFDKIKNSPFRKWYLGRAREIVKQVDERWAKANNEWAKEIEIACKGFIDVVNETIAYPGETYSKYKEIFKLPNDVLHVASGAPQKTPKELKDAERELTAEREKLTQKDFEKTIKSGKRSGKKKDTLTSLAELYSKYKQLRSEATGAEQIEKVELDDQKIRRALLEVLKHLTQVMIQWSNHPQADSFKKPEKLFASLAKRLEKLYDAGIFDEIERIEGHKNEADQDLQQLSMRGIREKFCRAYSKLEDQFAGKRPKGDFSGFARHYIGQAPRIERAKGQEGTSSSERPSSPTSSSSSTSSFSSFSERPSSPTPSSSNTSSFSSLLDAFRYRGQTQQVESPKEPRASSPFGSWKDRFSRSKSPTPPERRFAGSQQPDSPLSSSQSQGRDLSLSASGSAPEAPRSPVSLLGKGQIPTVSIFRPLTPSSQSTIETSSMMAEQSTFSSLAPPSPTGDRTLSPGTTSLPSISEENGPGLFMLP